MGHASELVLVRETQQKMVGQARKFVPQVRFYSYNGGGAKIALPASLEHADLDEATPSLTLGFRDSRSLQGEAKAVFLLPEVP